MKRRGNIIAPKRRLYMVKLFFITAAIIGTAIAGISVTSEKSQSPPASSAMRAAYTTYNAGDVSNTLDSQVALKKLDNINAAIVTTSRSSTTIGHNRGRISLVVIKTSKGKMILFVIAQTRSNETGSNEEIFDASSARSYSYLYI